MWNWQQPNWPDFSYKSEELSILEQQFMQNSGLCLGAFTHISENEKELLRIELISEEALKTSQIEGEMLNNDSIQSSLSRQFGLKTDNRRVPLAEQGIATMMVDLYNNFSEDLDHERLWQWHRMIMNGRNDLDVIGHYRAHTDTMQIVSGSIHKPKIHFEAPPSTLVPKEMAEFIKWFNDTAPNGKHRLPALTRAAIAHLYFVCIHPFEDGNGRIARALAEKALAQCLGYPSLIVLSYTIEKNKKAYYSALGRNSHSLDITNWLIYFAKIILEAQNNTQKRIEFIIDKSKLYAQVHGKLNKRQDKVLKRLFNTGIDGFTGGLSADNYIAITRASRATATRDLQGMVEMGALIKKGELRYTRYYLNVPFFQGGQ